PTATALPPTPTDTSEPTATETPVPPTPTQVPTPSSTALWRGLEIADEDRCSPYDSDDYRYSRSVEDRIVADMGGIIYGPYTGRWFSSTGETDIEHIVARSEAHDSGLCAADAQERRRFASDLLNLTLASPSVNRHQKVDNDAAEWLPDLNRCWFADRVILVRREYGLTIDEREARALDSVLSGCSSFEMVVVQTDQASPMPTPVSTTGSGSSPDALAMWDDNGNGRISCAEARNHGIAPVPRSHPAYRYMTDRDGDGVVCE
ncbi:MAG: excalibur calcium-binding domain-containing protein, partial [Dehalococcoidia bacterium]|nr:excalibur calcium-binding domain-containing protein [Dehalococcoidia bacterium]